MTPTLTKEQAVEVIEVIFDTSLSYAPTHPAVASLRAIAPGEHSVITAESLESIKRQVRNEALEEAARVCDLDLLYSKRTDLDGPTLLDCATAIRSLKTDGGGK